MDSAVKKRSNLIDATKDETSDKNGAIQGDVGKDKENPLIESEPTRFRKIQLAAKLPEWEIITFSFYMTACFLVSAYSLFKFSRKIEDIPYFKNSLQPGWSFLGRLKDYGDMEWYLMYHFRFKFTVVAIIHGVTSFLAHQYAFQYRRHVWTVVGIASMVWILGWKHVIFIWGLTTAFYVVTFMDNVLICWILGLATLTARSEKYSAWVQIVFNIDDEGEKIATMMVAISFLILKLMSFSIERVKRQNGTSEMEPSVTFTYFDLIVFTFYYPCYYLGPTFIYKYFQPQIIKPRKDWQRDEVMYIVQKFARSIFWMFFLEILLHFIYIHTCALEVEVLKRLPAWSLAAVVLYSSSFYQAKYCVSYGLPSCFMMLDRIVPPTNPRCIVRVAYFSEYWRFFDPGLHAFFRNYVYIPLGGSRHGKARQVVATAATFCFVCYWHGAHKSIQAWTMSNCVAVIIEIIAKRIMSLPAVSQFEEKNFSPAMIRRIHAICNVPLFIFSTNAIMMFYIGMTNTWVVFNALILNGSLITWITIYVFFYSMTIFCNEVERWEHANIQKNKSE